MTEFGGLDREQAQRFAEWLWGIRAGYAIVAFGRDPYYDENGSYRHRHWEEHPYHWPDERDRLFSDVNKELLDSAASGVKVDVYVCPMLRRTTRRKGSGAAHTDILTVDCDGKKPLDLSTLDRLGAVMMVDSGSEGHGHVYGKLIDQPAPVRRDELNRALLDEMGGDSGKWTDNGVLRLPGTVNGKHGQPVTIAYGPTGVALPAEEVGRVLGAGASVGSLTSPLTPIRLDTLPPRVREAFQRDPASFDSKRSGATHSLVYQCFMSGFTLTETLRVVAQHPPSVEKFGLRLEAETRRSWDSIVDEQQVKRRLITGVDVAPSVARNRPPKPDPAMFYGLLGDIVWRLDAHTEAAPVAVLVTLLAGASALMGAAVSKRPHVMIGATTHPLLLWPLVLGRTSEGRKGDSLSTAELILRQDPDKAYDKIRASGLSSGEGAIERIKDDPNSSIEVDRRLFIVETEFAVTLNRGRREGSSLTGVLRQLWDGAPLQTLNRKVVRASASHVNVLGHISPGEFRALLSQADLSGGFFNRFLPVYAQRPKLLPLPRPVPDDVRNTAASQLHKAIERAATLGEIGMTDDGAEVWEIVYDDLNAAAEDADDQLSAFVARAPAQARRVAALFAALDGAQDVTAAHVRAAAALVDYSIQSASYVLSALPDRRAEKILTALQAAGPGGLTTTQVSALFSRHVRADAIHAILKWLVDRGDVRHVSEATAGRPADRWTLADPTDAHSEESEIAK